MSIMKNIKKLSIKLGPMLLVAALISGCSSYSGQFGCPDARGLNCAPVSIVNAQIDSGAIERVASKAKVCKGGKCYQQNEINIKPELR